MPRGNDAKAALADLADKFGQGAGNAESLIEANLAMTPPLLRKAELLPRNEEETQKVRQGLDSLKGPDGEKVIDAAVRGAFPQAQITTIVYEDAEGRYRLAVLDEKNRAVKVDVPENVAAQAESAAEHSQAQKKG